VNEVVPAGPADIGAYAAWRSERRRVAKSCHPDIGGNPETFREQMRAVDVRFGVARSPAEPVIPSRRPPPTTVRLARAARRSRRRSRHAIRGIRAKLPRKMPGARRYIDL